MIEKAEKILSQALDAGFDEVSVSLKENTKNELNIAHNKISLMRSTSSENLRITAIRKNRRVSGSISSSEAETVNNLIKGLNRDVESTPPDEAHAVSAEQKGNFIQGPQDADLESMAKAAKTFLDFRKNEFPTFQVEESSFEHNLEKTAFVSSRDSALELNHGSYGMSVMGSGKDEHGSSSFTYTGGTMDKIPENIQDHFDIRTIMDDSARSTQTSLVGEKFTGEVLLMPNAVWGLLGWLFGQLGDFSLLQDISLYKDSVGENIAGDLLSLNHTLEGPGTFPFNGEGFLLEPFALLDKGKLLHLLPSYYGSRKLGLPYQPQGSGWDIATGSTPRENMIASVEKGAVVGRLSMGSPAPNGDFAGVIKNSYLLEKGKRSNSLSETMITGNIARMLKDITAVSRETTDFGSGNVPWVQIKGLKFS